MSLSLPPATVRLVCPPRRSEALVVEEIGGTCVAIWRGGVTAELFERQRAALASVVARHPFGAVFVCIIEPSAIPPNNHLRRASAEMVMAHRGRLRAVVCVVEATGFRAAIARSILSGMAFLARPGRLPIAVFGTTQQAAHWLAPRAPIGSPEAFVAAVERARARFSDW